jgi:hypothetical protein
MPRFASCLVAGVICVVAGCTSVRSIRAPAEPSVADTIAAQLAKDDAIPWASRRPLTWADFRGRAPDQPGVVAAETAYTILHGVRCAGSTFEFRVVAAFRPRDSWVRQSILGAPADAARALRHEQTHFDLAEVHARRMRRYFAELIAPCRLSTGDLAASADRMDRDERAAQAQYDADTDHGRDAAQQARWNKTVSDDLLALSRFAR